MIEAPSNPPSAVARWALRKKLPDPRVLTIAPRKRYCSRCPYVCEAISTAKPQVDGGVIKGLAMFDKKRSPVMPDLPTALEQGTENLEAYTWYGVFLPKNAPEDIVRKLHDASMQAVKTPALRERLDALGAVVVSDDRMATEYLGPFVKSEIEKWAVPIKASAVSVD